MFQNLMNLLSHVDGKRSHQFATKKTRIKLECLEERSCPATYHWNGPAGGNWDVQANWFENNGVPTNGDTIIFDNTTTNNSTCNIANLSLASLQITSGYTGTITLNNDLTVTGDVSIAKGTITSVNAAKKVIVPNATSTFT